MAAGHTIGDAKQAPDVLVPAGVEAVLVADCGAVGACLVELLEALAGIKNDLEGV
jgi:hypothetical protein